MADLDPKSTAPHAAPAIASRHDKRTIPAGRPANMEDNRARGGGFKTFLWVAPLTVLIWIYAEREQMDKIDTSARIKLVSRSADRLITVNKPESGFVSLDIQGPKASLNTLRDLLTKDALEVEINPEIGYGGDVSLAEAISKTDLFKTHAASVTSARPYFNIKVEAKGSRRIPVMQRPQDKILGNVSFEPTTVLLEGPKDTLDHMKPEDLVAYADLSAFRQKAPAEYADDVPITLPNYVANVTMTKTVRAKVKILQSKTYLIQYLPIVLQLPGFVVSGDKYKVTLKQPTLTSVEVAGPPDAIDMLEQGKFPTARIVLDLTNPARGVDFSLIQTTLEKPITLQASDYQLPPGVEVRNPNKDITVTITKRNE